MKKEKYYPPVHATGHFHCPHCGVHAEQKWSHLQAVGDCYTKRQSTVIRESKIRSVAHITSMLPETWTMSACEHCRVLAIWYEDKMIYPKKIMVDTPNSDLNEDIQNDYLEAANVFNDSPRASAALLRLALQKLCKQLGEKGKDINTDIKKLVEDGLNSRVQKALDSLRIIGNNGVHPGEINLKEEPEKVLKLFEIINFIAEKMITDEKEMNAFYDELPESSKEAVKKRDKK